MKRRQNSAAWAWLLVVAAVVALSFWLMKSGDGSGGNEAINLEEAQIKGNAKAMVVLEEFSDFQCPACAAYAPVVAEISKTFSADVAVVYRHLPLRSIHAYADKAARAAEAAGMQGKFWEMHDVLFAKQAEWSATGAQENFIAYAESIGLDKDRFLLDWASPNVQAKVMRDENLARVKNLSATPTFIINGKVLKNLGGPQSLKDAVLSAVNEAKKVPESN